jgi:hypothetical protein
MKILSVSNVEATASCGSASCGRPSMAVATASSPSPEAWEAKLSDRRNKISGNFPVICIMALVSQVNKGNFSAYAQKNPPFSLFSIR